MLLIDGVKYELWTPQNEDEFEQVVKEHTQEIFGQQSIYIDRKQKLKSLSGIGSIPDGYVIILGATPQWHIVEAELSSHPLDQHIVAQVSRFITGIKNPSTQRDIVRAMYDEITKDGYLKFKVEEAIKPTEIYKFLFDLISKPPILTIIIEKDTEGLREAISTLAHSDIKIVEFQTFVRESVGLIVHAHLFKPLVQTIVVSMAQVLSEKHQSTITPPAMTPFGDKAKKAAKVTFEELVQNGLLTDGEVLSFSYKQVNGEQAQVVASSNQLKYLADGKLYSKTSLAETIFKKHTGYEQSLQGPKFWKTANGKFLVDLEEKVRLQKGDRK